MAENFFLVLNLPLDATEAEIHEAYHRQVARHQGDAAQLAQIQRAYDVLSNPITRKRHRQSLEKQGQSSGSRDDSRAPGGVPPDRGCGDSGTIGSPRPGLTSPSRSYLPEESPARSKKRQPTVFIGADEAPDVTIPDQRPGASSGPASGGLAPGGESAASHRGKRQPTVLLSPDEALAGTPPRASPTPASRSGRQPTEHLDQKALAEPSPAGPQPGKDQPQRRPTEMIEPGQQPSAVRPPLFEPSSPLKPSPEQGRSATADHRPPSAAQTAPQPPYVHLSYQGENRVIGLQPGENLIGRPSKGGPELAIPLPDPQQFISRRHAKIVRDGLACVLIDEGSKNGTYLNGERVTPLRSYKLRDGDLITIEGREIHIYLS